MPTVADIVEAYAPRTGLNIRRPGLSPNPRTPIGPIEPWFDATHEFVRTFLHPELYDPQHARHAIRMYCHRIYQWHRDGNTPEIADAAFLKFLDRIDRQSFDCDTCQRAVIVVNAHTDPCPHCGFTCPHCG